MGYKILLMEQNYKKYYFMLVRMSQTKFNSEHYTKCRCHNVISLFSQKCVYFLQETGVNIYVLFHLRKKKTYLVILSDHFYIKEGEALRCKIGPTLY